MNEARHGMNLRVHETIFFSLLKNNVSDSTFLEIRKKDSTGKNTRDKNQGGSQGEKTKEDKTQRQRDDCCWVQRTFVSVSAGDTKQRREMRRREM